VEYNKKGDIGALSVLSIISEAGTLAAGLELVYNINGCNSLSDLF
jgi:hypothetical protein